MISSPHISADDMAYVRFGNAELAGDRCAIAMTSGDQSSDFSDIGCGQARMWIGFAPDVATIPMVCRTLLGSRHKPSALRTHVGQVVRTGSDEQVVWSHTSAIVATVKNPEAIRDVSEVDLPGEAVGVISQPTVVMQDTEDAIALPACGRPFPTAVSLLDFRPEPLLPFHLKEYTSCH